MTLGWVDEGVDGGVDGWLGGGDPSFHRRSSFAYEAARRVIDASSAGRWQWRRIHVQLKAYHNSLATLSEAE